MAWLETVQQGPTHTYLHMHLWLTSDWSYQGGYFSGLNFIETIIYFLMSAELRFA